MIFAMADGQTLEHHWKRNAKKDSWTDECRQRASTYRRNHAVTRADISCFTTKIKCAECGNNYRRQTRRKSTGEKYYLFACATTNTCGNKCIHEDTLKELAAEALGLSEFDDAAFADQIDHVDIAPGGHITFVFKDCDSKAMTYSTKRRMPKWTEERRERQSEAIKASFTDERRQHMSEKMKQIRSELYWNSTGKSKQSQQP